MCADEHIVKADLILVFASENEGGAEALASGMGRRSHA